MAMWLHDWFGGFNDNHLMFGLAIFIIANIAFVAGTNMYYRYINDEPTLWARIKSGEFWSQGRYMDPPHTYDYKNEKVMKKELE